MRDLSRSLTLMLLLAVMFAGLLGACSSSVDSTADDATRDVAVRSYEPRPAATPSRQRSRAISWRRLR